MKIFSNFDTKLKRHTYRGYQEKYGAENVICIVRSKLYRFLKVFFPSLFLVALSLLAIRLFYQWVGVNLNYIIIGVVVLDIFFMFPVIGKYIEYKLDFVIVASESVIMYSQMGIFQRDVITIPAQNIKTILVKKESFLYSVFNNGDIVIMTE